MHRHPDKSLAVAVDAELTTVVDEVVPDGQLAMAIFGRNGRRDSGIANHTKSGAEPQSRLGTLEPLSVPGLFTR